MNWKNLGNATLITAVLFGIVALFLWLGHYCPWALVVIGFVGLVAIIYRAMERDDETNDNNKDLEEPDVKGYDEAYLNEKIAKATKSWEGVDVDKFIDEIRGREPKGEKEDEE